MSLDAIFFFIEIFWKRRLSRPVRPPQPSHLYGILFIGFLLRNVVCRRLFATFAAMHASGKHQACEFQPTTHYSYSLHDCVYLQMCSRQTDRIETMWRIPKSHKVFVYFHNVFLFGFSRVTLVSWSCLCCLLFSMVARNSLGRCLCRDFSVCVFTTFGESSFCCRKFHFVQEKHDGDPFQWVLLPSDAPSSRLLAMANLRACVCAFMSKEGRRRHHHRRSSI